MIAFPSMLVNAAEKAGMTIPSDPDGNFNHINYPHFFVFCQLQLGRRMKMDGEHFRNAEIIASIPTERVVTMTLGDFLAEGLEWST